MQKGKERGKSNCCITSATHMEEYRKKREAFFFSYINSVESEFRTCINCCVKLIHLMLKILE